MPSIQDVYALYQGRGYPGQLARPNAPYAFQQGTAGVVTGTSLRSGYGVKYDQTNNDFRLPTSDADALEVIGIASYDMGAIQSSLTATPDGENSDQVIEIRDNRPIRVGLEGWFWAIAGGALEFGDILRYDPDDENWRKITTPTAISGLPRLVASCAEFSVPSGELFQMRLSGVTPR